jgi:branched-chain amino acid aminotransferase
MLSLRVTSFSRTALNFTAIRSLSNIDSKLLEIKKTSSPKPKIPHKDLVFGKTFTDHILEIEYDVASGWNKPKISPYHNISLDPSASVFHYGLELFEGLKVYKDKDQKIRLFRPNKNMERMVNSAKRLAFPEFDGNELLKCIAELVKLDHSWIPQERGYSLYLRPTMIATQPALGVGPSNTVLLFVICSPVGPYYKTGFNAVSLYADDQYVRAWPGGTGAAKIGPNYGPTILPQSLASKKGYAQILWLFGPEHYVTEVGTMNLFTFWKNENGERELITPPLDGTILPGVTRDSILQLARDWKEFKVSEKSYTMKDIIKAVKEKRIIEMFGAGTAAIVSPIKQIHYRGTDYEIPLDPSDKTKQAGALTTRIADQIMGIQYGDIASPWSVVV